MIYKIQSNVAHLFICAAIFLFPSIVSSQGFVVDDAPFVTTWVTNNVSGGQVDSTSITIPTGNGIFDYEVDWDYDGTTFDADTTGVTGSVTHDYGIVDTVTIAIKGTFPHIRLAYSTQGLKIINIDAWGDIVWSSMWTSYFDCENLDSDATDTPNVSNVTDFSHCFSGCTNFNGNVSNWDVSSATNMSSMFRDAVSFNPDSLNWDVSSVEDMNSMFIVSIYGDSSKFNGYIGGWDVSKVTDMSDMFRQATSFNPDSLNWDVSSVTDMNFMFFRATSFNGFIGGWDVSKVTDMSRMFSDAPAFAPDSLNWDVSKVTDMSGMFDEAIMFNPTELDWDVSSVTDMTSMFQEASTFAPDSLNWDVSRVKLMIGMFSEAPAFNANISNWQVDSVTNMSAMFSLATSFNPDSLNWNVDAVKDMSSMFTGATSFNSDISNWQVDSVINMSRMFQGATSFNSDISNWQVGSVNNMLRMFSGATLFNVDISNWDVGSVRDMTLMFSRASSFDSDISDWNITKVTDMRRMLDNTPMSIANFDSLLNKWSALDVQSGVILGASGLKYCGGVIGKSDLETNHNWTISGATEVCPGELLITQSADNTTTSEEGSLDTIMIALGITPTSDVVVNVTIDDDSEGSIAKGSEDVLTAQPDKTNHIKSSSSPIQLTFTSGNWDVPQLIIVTGLDDNEADGDIAYKLTIATVDDNSDDAYDGITKSITVINQDDEEICYEVSTLAGTGMIGDEIGPGASAQFRFPKGIVTDTMGNVFIVDSDNHKIKKIDANGNVSTIAGSTIGDTNGTGSAAQFWSPAGIIADNQGNFYITDKMNHKIKKIDQNGLVSTVAGNGNIGSSDGPVASAEFKNPQGITIDASGNLYVSDTENHTIRKISTDGMVTTLAGTAGTSGDKDSTGVFALFEEPQGLLFDLEDNLLVADYRNNKIKKIAPDGTVSTFQFVGGGPADRDITPPILASPSSLTMDSQGNLYVVTQFAQKIRKITPGGVISTIAGTGSASFADGEGSMARFNYPFGIAIDKEDNLYITDVPNQRIRKITSQVCVTVDIDIVESGNNTLTNESGITDTVLISLLEAPATDVVVKVEVSDSTEGSIALGANSGQGAIKQEDTFKSFASTDINLTFTYADWNVPQAIIITGLDDDEVDGDITYNLTATVVDASSDDAYDGVSKMIQVTNKDDGEPCLGNTPTIGTIDVTHSILCGVGATGELKVNLTNSVSPVEYSIDNGTNWSTDATFSNLDGGIYQVTARYNNGTITCMADTVIATEVKCIIDLNETFNNTSFSDPIIDGPHAICGGASAIFSLMDSVIKCTPIMVYDEFLMDSVVGSSCVLAPLVADATDYVWFSSMTSGTETMDTPSPDYIVNHSTDEDSTIITIFITDDNGDIYNAKKTLYFLTDAECAAYKCQQTVHVGQAEMMNNQVPSNVTAQQTISSDGIVGFNKTYTFKAGNQVEFQEEFEVSKGGTLLADIVNCGSTE